MSLRFEADPECQADLREIQALATSSKALKLQTARKCSENTKSGGWGKQMKSNSLLTSKDGVTERCWNWQEPTLELLQTFRHKAVGKRP